MAKIGILGAGSWGTALAVLLGNNAHEVFIWGRPEDGVEKIQAERENRRFLPGVKIPHRVHPTTDMEAVLEGADLVLLSVPSQAIRTVASRSKSYLGKDVSIVNTAKGLELSSGKRLSQVLEEELGSEIRTRLAILSGPSHAEEVGRGIPTAVTVAAYSQEVAFQVQDIFMGPNFRVYTNPDVAGVELGGALKNIVALATGISYGLGYGDNTMAALMTRGLTEISRMGEALGGDPRTFSGLSGMGDLVVTCCSQHSRNRRAGELIGKGYSLEETLSAIGMVVEGAHAVRVVSSLASQMGVEMPIAEACNRILYQGKDPRREVWNLMQRQKKHEIEEIAISFYSC